MLVDTDPDCRPQRSSQLNEIAYLGRRDRMSYRESKGHKSGLRALLLYFKRITEQTLSQHQWNIEMPKVAVFVHRLI